VLGELEKNKGKIFKNERLEEISEIQENCEKSEILKNSEI
jgi:hypothetical protein